MATKPLVSLYSATGVGVILLYPSGVFYSNQVGGVSCLQPTAEGLYVPLRNEVLDQEQMLLDYFTGPKYRGGCANGIDNEDADAIDQILQRSIFTSFIKVDRTRLLNSCEAWVYVDIAKQPDERPSGYNGAEGVGITSSGKTIRDADYDLRIMAYPFYGFGQTTGILTWSNSD